MIKVTDLVKDFGRRRAVDGGSGPIRIYDATISYEQNTASAAESSRPD